MKSCVPKERVATSPEWTETLLRTVWFLGMLLFGNKLTST